MVNSTQGIFMALAMAFMVCATGIAVHLYNAPASKFSHPTLNPVDSLFDAKGPIGGEGMAPKKGMAGGKSTSRLGYEIPADYQNLVEGNDLLAMENDRLMKRLAQLKNEKNELVGQEHFARNSFDVFQTQSAADLKYIQEARAKLDADNQELREKIALGQHMDEPIPPRTNQPIRRRTPLDDYQDYKTSMLQLTDILQGKDDSKTVKQAAVLHYNMGNFFVKNKKYHHALQEYRKALFYNPHDPDAHYNIALVYDMHLEDYNMAITHYNEILALNPKRDYITSVEKRVLLLQEKLLLIAED